MVMDKRAELLRIEETAPGIWEWVAAKTVWVHTEPYNKLNLFSKVGISAKSILFRLVPISGVTPHDALRVGGQHYFITAITRVSPVRMEILTAETVPVPCTARIMRAIVDEKKRARYSAEKTLAFPAILTEKFLKFSQEEPMGEIDLTFVLVTPKTIELETGNIVRSGDAAYTVQVCHTLDEYKNEYEVYREENP